MDQQDAYTYDEAGRLVRVKVDMSPEYDPDTDLRLVYTYRCPGD